MNSAMLRERFERRDSITRNPSLAPSVAPSPAAIPGAGVRSVHGFRQRVRAEKTMTNQATINDSSNQESSTLDGGLRRLALREAPVGVGKDDLDPPVLLAARGGVVGRDRIALAAAHRAHIIR